MKKLLILVMLAMMIALSSGCGSLRGTSRGLRELGKGIKSDAQGAWSALKRADAKFQEKYW